MIARGGSRAATSAQRSEYRARSLGSGRSINRDEFRPEDVRNRPTFAYREGERGGAQFLLRFAAGPLDGQYRIRQFTEGIAVAIRSRLSIRRQSVVRHAVRYVVSIERRSRAFKNATVDQCAEKSC